MKGKYWMWRLGLMLWSAFSLPAGAALVDRGDGVILDTVLNIYWLQDASLGGNGTWASSVAWAESLEFAGLSNWRLPFMDANGDTQWTDCKNATELACRDNEFGYMYYHNLGGSPGDDLTGDQPPFEAIQRYHWMFGPGGTDGWFDFAQGDSFPNAPSGRVFAAWAVHPVPVPAAAWLLATGLLGFAGFVRRQR